MYSELAHIVHDETCLLLVKSFIRLNDMKGQEFGGLDDDVVAGCAADKLVEMRDRIDRISVLLLPGFFGSMRFRTWRP